MDNQVGCFGVERSEWIFKSDALKWRGWSEYSRGMLWDGVVEVDIQEG